MIGLWIGCFIAIFSCIAFTFILKETIRDFNKKGPKLEEQDKNINKKEVKESLLIDESNRQLTRKEDARFFESKNTYDYSCYEEKMKNRLSYSSGAKKAYVLNKTRFMRAFNILKKVLNIDYVILKIGLNVLLNNDETVDLHDILNKKSKAVILKDISSFSSVDYDMTLCYIKTSKKKLFEVISVFDWKKIEYIVIFNDLQPSIMTYSDICFSSAVSDFILGVDKLGVSLKINYKELCKNYSELYDDVEELIWGVVSCFENKSF